MPNDDALPSELEEAFEAAWLVIAGRKRPIMPSEEAQLRLALARCIAQLSTSGITDPRELRRRAIEQMTLDPD